MTMSAELIDRILEAVHVGETTDWEFKSARGGFPGSFWETYSAMANSDGGIVILGVREDEHGAAAGRPHSGSDSRAIRKSSGTA